MEYTVSFPGGDVRYLFNASFDALQGLTDTANAVIITDSKVAALYQDRLAPYRKVVIEPGEEHKKLKAINIIAEELLEMEAHRKTTIIGVGGGMVTDMAGFASAVYMRGLRFGFVPTTLLGMVDAAIGGKNGVNFGLHKNMLGTITQPAFILFDTSFLSTLSEQEWSNGFAEIIKYACIFDKELFYELEQNTIKNYQQNEEKLIHLIRRCADWKNKTVMADEKESGQRKLLNFGHTAGHAIETLYNLPHGYAVALGMILACRLSEKYNEQLSGSAERIAALLKRYNLPVHYDIDVNKVMNILKMDKKRSTDSIDYIILRDIGEAAIQPVSFDEIKQAIEDFSHAGNN